MSTSGVTNATMTAQDIVQAAMEELGVLSAGETVTGSELQTGLRSLQWMLKSFTARGINKWREAQITVTVPAGAASIDLPQSVEDVLDARVPVSGTYERMLFRYERGQYQQLPNKAAPGSPVNYYVDRQRDMATLYVWPVPQVDTVLTLDVLRVIDDVVEPDQEVDVPQKWIETVYIGLAARLASVMGVTRTDPGTAQMLANRAQAFEQILLDDDRPASVYLGGYGERYF